jgi:hypothetical protein
MQYEHTQLSKWTLALAAVLLVTILVSAIAGWTEAVGGPWWYLVFVAIAIVLLVAGRLTVVVTDAEVSAAFGLGWPHRRIALDEVTEVQRVRIRWFHGWGIRKVPGGSMFNTAGWDAVELKRSTGGVFWIGTDQPEELLAALTTARADSTP